MFISKADEEIMALDVPERLQVSIDRLKD